MDIIKQTEVFKPLSVAKLENGVILLIYDGYAVGSDGKRYYNVSKVETVYDEHYDFEDEEYVNLGWSSDIDEPMIIE